MSAATLGRLVRQVRRQIDPASESGDSLLLARWIDQADQSAFELLLWRHGPMVWDTCRRVLRHDQDAEDAFQACFLALARKAGSIRQFPSLASWLYRVAHRAALSARTRPGHAESRSDLDEVASVRPDQGELRLFLDEEIGRLPQRYREPFVLCYLQGLTTDEAAEVLGCPRGTVGTRVAWARRRLRDRLQRRGADLPATLPLTALPPELVESALLSVTNPESIAPAVAGLFQEILTVMWMNRLQTVALWLAPVLVVLAGLGGLTLTSAAEKPADKKKPAEDKPKVKPNTDKKPDADKKGADIQGVVKTVTNDGKTVTIVTRRKTKDQDEETIDLKLNDKTTVTFSSVGPGEAKVKVGYHVSAWLVENSKDTAARVSFHGEKSSKGTKPSLSGQISSVADNGKSFTITVSKKTKTEDAVEKTIKIGDKTEVVFQFVGSGEAKLVKDMHVNVWLAEGSEDTAARVSSGGKPDLPTKKDGESVAHRGTVSAVSKDGKSITITEITKKNEEATKTELKVGENSRLLFSGVGPGKAKIEKGQSATIWVNANAKDTIAIAHFQTEQPGKQIGLAGKVVSVADDGKSFTLLTPPTKKNEEGKEVKIALAVKAQVLFDNVAPGGAKITKDYSARVTFAEGSKDTASMVVFGRAK